MQHNELKYIKSQCPLCNKMKAQIIQVFNSQNVAQHLKIKENEPQFAALTAHIEKLWGSDTCYFVHCLNCSFCYAVPNISGDSKFYKIVYTEESNYPQWKWDFQITYNTIDKMIKQKVLNSFKLLEIGAGSGAFVKKIALNLTNRENILATEFSSYGQNEINKFGIKCLSSDIWDINSTEYKERFDLVCMFQVLEHMNNFDKLFCHISWLTKKDAHLFITVPNNFHRDFYERHGFIEDVPPIHIGRWNRKSFDLIAEKYGWIVINHKIEPKYFLRNIGKFFHLKYRKFNFLRNIDNIKNISLRKLFKAIIFVPFLIINIKIIISSYNKDLGVSQWVHLRKN